MTGRSLREDQLTLALTVAEHCMAVTAYGNLKTAPVRELNQLHDILNGACLKHREGRAPHDMSKVVRSRLPRGIIKEECPTEVSEIVAQQLPHGS